MWLLVSLPIVTLGASTIAAFTVAMRFVEDEEGHVAHDFVKAFKANIKQGIPMSFINLLSFNLFFHIILTILFTKIKSIPNYFIKNVILR